MTEFRNRLKTAEKVLRNMLAQPYFELVVNDSVERCVADVRAIVETRQADDARQRHGQEVAQRLLHKIQHALEADA